MPFFIINSKSAYNIYSTNKMAPVFSSAVTLKELKLFYEGNYGECTLAELPARLQRAKKTGCSAYQITLENCIRYNKAGEDKTELSFEDFVAKYLTLDKEK